MFSDRSVLRINKIGFTENLHNKVKRQIKYNNNNNNSNK